MKQNIVIYATESLYFSERDQLTGVPGVPVEMGESDQLTAALASEDKEYKNSRGEVVQSIPMPPTVSLTIGIKNISVENMAMGLKAKVVEIASGVATDVVVVAPKVALAAAHGQAIQNVHDGHTTAWQRLPGSGRRVGQNGSIAVVVTVCSTSNHKSVETWQGKIWRGVVVAVVLDTTDFHPTDKEWVSSVQYDEQRDFGMRMARVHISSGWNSMMVNGNVPRQRRICPDSKRNSGRHHHTDRSGHEFSQAALYPHYPGRMRQG